ncbi:MAG: ABC transporter ATP-binding protein [bacterium]|nr:ABC transporter ATP-binding protein [bacterium]
MKIRLKNINKTFQLQTGRQLKVLENINLDIAEGEFLIILGESGCGKSTLLNLMAGMIPPTSGEIEIAGKPVKIPHPSRVLLFQQPSLLPWLNVEENITFGCKIRGETENLRQRTGHYIELMGLKGIEKVHPPELSLGMAHRVSLARALMGNPEILFLDEPFRSLDTFTSIRLADELINLWERERFTGVFVTHNIEEAIALGSKIVLLSGRPTAITNTFNVELDHPRSAVDEKFIELRELIFETVKNTYRVGGTGGAHNE